MPLTLNEIRDLQSGDRVRVTWFGGNGPHVYLLERDAVGAILTCTQGLPAGYTGCLYDPLRDRNAKVAIHQVERLPPKELDTIADVVLAYRPKPKTKPAKRRKRQAAKIAAAPSI